LPGVTGVVLLGFMARDGWAQDSWPEDPSDDAPFRPECGNPPPEMEDPSPGDGNDCWEYTESDGWAQLFECIEEIIECPAVDCEPVPGEGCACLLIGDSESFSFAMPSWTVEPGRKEIKPDNPDCGDAEEKEITPGADDSWVVTGGEGVVAVAPRSGSGDADFTVTAVAEGCAELVVTWRLTLSMEEDCQKEFTEEGPAVSVCVIDPTPPDPARRGMTARAADGGDCDVRKVGYKGGWLGRIEPPKIRITVECEKKCQAGEDCQLYSPHVLIEMTKPGIITVETERRTISWPPDYCDRTQAAIDRTTAHEQTHCRLFNKAFAKLKQDFEAENGKRPAKPCADCEAAARALMEAAKAAWEAAVDAASNHGNPDIQGTPRQCRFMDDKKPCATEDCASNPAHPTGAPPCQYDNTDSGDGGGFPDVWSTPAVSQTPCFKIAQESKKRGVQ
jgi:hypothetical protein